MPHAKTCLDCGKLIPADKTRCSDCQRKRNAAHNAPRAKYRTPAWRKRRRAAVAGGCEVCGSRDRVAAHHIFNARTEGGWDGPLMALCQQHHSEYEADVRHGRDTELRRTVELIGGRSDAEREDALRPVRE